MKIVEPTAPRTMPVVASPRPPAMPSDFEVAGAASAPKTIAEDPQAAAPARQNVASSDRIPSTSETTALLSVDCAGPPTGQPCGGGGGPGIGCIAPRIAQPPQSHCAGAQPGFFAPGAPIVPP